MWSKNRSPRTKGWGGRGLPVGRARGRLADSASKVRSGGSAGGCGELFDALAGTTAVGVDELGVVRAGVQEGDAQAATVRVKSEQRSQGAPVRFGRLARDLAPVLPRVSQRRATGLCSSQRASQPASQAMNAMAHAAWRRH